MERIETIDGLRLALDGCRRGGRTVGLVPTMGALHEGHVSLIRAAVSQCDVVVTTIFVNPLQFAPADDLDAYPRDASGDGALAAGARSSILFTPSVAEMFPFGPRGVLTNVSVAGITDVLDGLARPGHFDGVATVVAKLFAIAGPCTAFFGEKDWQQLAVVRRMAADLSFAVEIVGCPTVREADGLAMSSRNRYLSPADRDEADVVWRALQAGRRVVESNLPGSAGPNPAGSGPDQAGSGPNQAGSGPNQADFPWGNEKRRRLGSDDVRLGSVGLGSDDVRLGSVGLGSDDVRLGSVGVSSTDVTAAMLAVLNASPVVQSVDYAACVDPHTLQAPSLVHSPVRLLIAARVGRHGTVARLIDNCAAAPA